MNRQACQLSSVVPCLMRENRRSRVKREASGGLQQSLLFKEALDVIGARARVGIRRLEHHVG
jgi:hypothetical protein